MKKFERLQTIKIIDIDGSSLDVKTSVYLKMYAVAYRDSILREDIYDITNAVEKFDAGNAAYIGPPAIIWDEIKELSELCEKHDAEYIRFTR